MTTETVAKESKLGCLPILGIILVTMLVTAGATIWLINNQLFAKNFEPVELTPEEQQVLTNKLERVGLSGDEQTTDNLASNAETTTAASDDGTPEPYSEDPSKRRITLSERELNGLLAKGNGPGRTFGDRSCR